MLSKLDKYAFIKQISLINNTYFQLCIDTKPQRIRSWTWPI